MPNIKSAEKRMRSNERKRIHNKTVKTRIRSLEKKYIGQVQSRNVDGANATLKDTTSALDKAVKTGIVHKTAANRRKSRLSKKLGAIK
ncbi:MAG: 30S ribosomal protein S20 [Verrucomicrobia bacterium]|nr:30S ribosomal protein S20 [Verrucomicrobiota bacterium]MCF7709032.1 30S ribosomal protein S20 [Verrucomicrobiota bacterium]